MKFSPDNTTIVVTDPQKDYCDSKWRCATELWWNVWNLYEIADRLWHFIDMVKNDFDVILLQNEEAQETYPHNMPFDPNDFVPLCVKWTPWHDFHPAINSEWCKVIPKNHPSWFAKKRWEDMSGLEWELRHNSIWRVNLLHAWFLAGRCVNATIIWASNAWFKNHVLTDLTWNPLWDKMQEEERVTRALWKSHYTMSQIDSSNIELH